MKFAILFSVLTSSFILCFSIGRADEIASQTESDDFYASARCTVVSRGGRRDVPHCAPNAPYICYASVRYADGSTQSFYGSSCTFATETCEVGYLSITPACAR